MRTVTRGVRLRGNCCSTSSSSGHHRCVWGRRRRRRWEAERSAAGPGSRADISKGGGGGGLSHGSCSSCVLSSSASLRHAGVDCAQGPPKGITGMIHRTQDWLAQRAGGAKGVPSQLDSQVCYSRPELRAPTDSSLLPSEPSIRPSVPLPLSCLSSPPLAPSPAYLPFTLSLPPRPIALATFCSPPFVPPLSVFPPSLLPPFNSLSLP